MTEPPIDAPRDPLYKTTREVHKVWAITVVESLGICEIICFFNVIKCFNVKWIS